MIITVVSLVAGVCAFIWVCESDYAAGSSLEATSQLSLINTTHWWKLNSFIHIISYHIMPQNVCVCSASWLHNRGASRCGNGLCFCFQSTLFFVRRQSTEVRYCICGLCGLCSGWVELCRPCCSYHKRMGPHYRGIKMIKFKAVMWCHTGLNWSRRKRRRCQDRATPQVYLGRYAPVQALTYHHFFISCRYVATHSSFGVIKCVADWRYVTALPMVTYSYVDQWRKSKFESLLAWKAQVLFSVKGQSVPPGLLPWDECVQYMSSAFRRKS